MEPVNADSRDADASPLDVALARVGDRWSLRVVEALLPGPRRFGDLQADIPGIAPNILSERLKRLERERVLSGRPYSDRPPRFAYELTADGHALAGALRLLADWGSRDSHRAEPVRHGPCGTPLEARWYCPTCARAVEGPEVDEVQVV
jgi:DNA-binding HxlR family transcriptional regulator